jgi:outer membrane protein with beta-barrel domain
MSIHGVQPLRRRAAFCVPLAVLAVTITAIPAAMAQTQSSNEFASSTQSLIAEIAEPAGAPGPSAASADQSRGTYGYHDHSVTSRLTFEGGGGFNAPIGNDSPVITWGGNFTVGGGYRFDKRVSVLAEYQFMDNKLPGGLISDAGAQGGHAHIWSLTLDPVIDLFPSRKNDIYVTGGGGFYRKVTSFTDPEEVEQCYYFCEIGTENVVVSHFSSNQGGLNFGVGITHKVGGDEHLKAFAEVRYVWLNTPGIGSPDGLGSTELLPVTLGVRW